MTSGTLQEWVMTESHVRDTPARCYGTPVHLRHADARTHGE